MCLYPMLTNHPRRFGKAVRYAYSNGSLAKTASALAKMVEVTQIKRSSVFKLYLFIFYIY